MKCYYTTTLTNLCGYILVHYHPVSVHTVSVLFILIIVLFCMQSHVLYVDFHYDHNNWRVKQLHAVRSRALQVCIDKDVCSRSQLSYSHSQDRRKRKGCKGFGLCIILAFRWNHMCGPLHHFGILLKPHVGLCIILAFCWNYGCGVGCGHNAPLH